METGIYIKIPGITGDVTEGSHKQWIKLTKLNFSANRKLSAEPGHIANRESSRPSLSELALSKPMDSASSLLFGEACTGKSKSQVIIDCCKTGVKGLVTIAQFTLENVIVSGYQLDTDVLINSQDIEGNINTYTGALEHIRLSFDKIEMKTIPYDAAGKQQTPIAYAYDLKTAAAA